MFTKAKKPNDLHKFIATGGKPQNYKSTAGKMPSKKSATKK
jgi:hypothetical protein